MEQGQNKPAHSEQSKLAGNASRCILQALPTAVLVSMIRTELHTVTVVAQLVLSASFVACLASVIHCGYGDLPVAVANS